MIYDFIRGRPQNFNLEIFYNERFPGNSKSQRAKGSKGQKVEGSNSIEEYRTRNNDFRFYEGKIS